MKTRQKLDPFLFFFTFRANFIKLKSNCSYNAYSSLDFLKEKLLTVSIVFLRYVIKFQKQLFFLPYVIKNPNFGLIGVIAANPAKMTLLRESA